jgi:predicted CoA-substrate-specific enzyme activase
MLTMGMDVGSTTCKSVILWDGCQIVARAVVPLGIGTIGPRRAFDEALAICGKNRNEIGRILVTGYGRFTFGEADNQRSELSCHALGVRSLIPTARTVIDIGGQDVKAMKLDERGGLENFAMNDKCAAGTGRFLDVMAKVMNVGTEELGRLSEEATEELSISNTCTVFAESEVISKLASNEPIPNLIAGIHASVAKRIAALAFRNGIVEEVAMSGGVALNGGVVRALGKELGTRILVHPDCQLAGALGAALFAYQESTT